MAATLQNRALIFIKPHAADSEGVQPFVVEALKKHGVRLLAEGMLTGREIADRNIIDQHYAAIAEYGALKDPKEVPMDDEGRARYREAYGAEWNAARRRNALQFQEETGVTASELNAMWERADFTKLMPGCYVAPLSVKGHPTTTVVNGFYPSMRAIFLTADASVIWFDSEFDPDALHWSTFRNTVIGATNPAEAAAGSIRNELYKHPSRYGLSERPTMQLNGVHASAGPLEAARERMIWLQRDAAQFPLLDALRDRGVGDGILRDLLQNPTVEVNGETEPLFDVLEDVDADQALRFLLDRYSQ